MARDNVKIPAKHYVGMVKRDKEKLPLGFITPWGEDAAALKRMATVDSWSKQGYNSTSLAPLVIDNVPMSGFKMTTDIRSSSYGGVDKWRIEDPRGFELEITSGNLANLLSVGMIDRGEIMDQCVWARSGQSNVLLSTETPEYKDAVENTVVANLKTDWKDAKPGNTVLLQNNVKGVWLGRMHQLVRKSTYDQPGTVGHDEIGSSDKSMHVIFIDNVKPLYGSHTSELHLITNPKLAAILDTTEMTEAAAELLANERLQDSTCSTVQNGYADVLALTFGSTKPGKNYQFELTKISVDSADELSKILANRRSSYATFINIDTGLYKLHERHTYNSAPIVAAQYDQQSFLANELRAVCHLYSSSGYYRTASSYQQLTRDFVWSPDITYMNLNIKLTTRNGNVINVIAN
jgi:hypothetical protein